MKEWRRGTVCPENWIERATKVSSQTLAVLLCAILGGEMSQETSLLTGLLLAEGWDNGAEDSGDTEDELRR